MQLVSTGISVVMARANAPQAGSATISPHAEFAESSRRSRVLQEARLGDRLAARDNGGQVGEFADDEGFSDFAAGEDIAG